MIIYYRMLGKDGLYLITDDKQVGYLTGCRTPDGYAVFDGDKKLFFIDSRYFYAVRKKLGDGWKAILGSQREALEYVAAQNKPLSVDFRYTTLDFAERMKDLGIQVVDCSQELQSMMIIKSETELASIAKACSIAERAFKRTLKILKVGITELEVADYLEREFKQLGASCPSFETIVGFGANAAVPHHVTGKKKLTPDTVVLMDFGCVYDGYCSDMTRTVFFGKPDKEFVKAYDAVLKAHVRAAEGIYEGIPVSEVDLIARRSLEKDGYGKAFTHSLGHGVGMNIHEAPWLSPKGTGELKNGMVHSIEPGVYLNGRFGIRIEDTVAMVDGKCKSFMTFTKKLVKLKVK